MLEALVALVALLVSLLGGYFIWLHKFVVSVKINQVQTSSAIENIREKIDSIDNAVNHAEAGEKTLRQYVVDMHYRLRHIENITVSKNNESNNISEGRSGAPSLPGDDAPFDLIRASRSSRRD